MSLSLLQAVKLNLSPLYLMLPGCVACSFAFMLPVATPPNAIIYSGGHLKVVEMVSHCCYRGEMVSHCCYRGEMVSHCCYRGEMFSAKRECDLNKFQLFRNVPKGHFKSNNQFTLCKEQDMRDRGTTEAARGSAPRLYSKIVQTCAIAVNANNESI